MKKKKVVIVHIGNVLKYPPVLNLIDNLLNNGHIVKILTQNTQEMPKKILKHENFQSIELPFIQGKDIVTRLRRRFIQNVEIRNIVDGLMNDSDILWTTTDLTVRFLGNTVLKYRHVMQLMELISWYPLYGGAKKLRFPIDKYAQKAWKVVVPEENRAYIQKVWFKLKKKPYVLPNKPYSLEIEGISENLKDILDSVKAEKRKIIMYLGYIGQDRKLDIFAEAVHQLREEYCLYMIGNIAPDQEVEFQKLCCKYDCIRYLGYFPAPKHLLFLKYAYIGLLPYNANDSHAYIPSINALYCAPNKIFEYAGFSGPMIGTDVPGLKWPFLQYHIGVCCESDEVEKIIQAICYIGHNYSEMKKNCRRYYESVDLDQIVEDILYH